MLHIGRNGLGQPVAELFHRRTRLRSGHHSLLVVVHSAKTFFYSFVHTPDNWRRSKPKLRRCSKRPRISSNNRCSTGPGRLTWDESHRGRNRVNAACCHVGSARRGSAPARLCHHTHRHPTATRTVTYRATRSYEWAFAVNVSSCGPRAPAARRMAASSSVK